MVGKGASAIVGRDAEISLAGGLVSAAATGHAEPPIEVRALAPTVPGMLRLLNHDLAAAARLFDESMTRLSGHEEAAPVPHWGLWALLRTVTADRDEEARDELRHSYAVLRDVNRGVLHYADADAAGRAGRAAEATELRGTPIYIHPGCMFPWNPPTDRADRDGPARTGGGHAMGRSELLGTPRTVQLRQGTITYHERGTGPPVVFVHGLLVNADLWRNVVPQVTEAGHRCLAPDWPLGSHEQPMRPDADLSPGGLADLIADFLAALDLTDVTLVANDTGGALVQMLMTRRPERIGRVVLASCDALERFFPPMFGFLPVTARLPGSAWLLAQVLRSRPAQRLPIAYGWLSQRPIPARVMDSYLRPARRSAGIRRDLRRFLRGVHRRHTLAAAGSFGSFDRPVLLAWAEHDRLFPLSLAHRLAAMLPDARLRVVTGSRTLIPEDRPDALADLIAEFARTTAARGR